MENQDVTEIDLRDLFYILLRRWYLILLCFIIAVGIAFGVTWFYLTPTYQAETTLFLGKEQNSIGSISLSDLQLGNQLIVDYRGIILSRLVSQDVIDSLNLDMPYEKFKTRVNVNIVSNSRLFTITFDSSNPQLAADVSNKLADVIIQKAAEIVEVKNVKIIDRAIVPLLPIKPQKAMNLLIGTGLGLILGIFLVFLLEFLDHTFKKPDDVEKQLGLAIMGTIPRFIGDNRHDKSKKGKGKASKEKAGDAPQDGSRTLITQYQPKSPASEAYRALRTNLHYASINKEIKTLVVTSPSMADGKSTTAVNLAISMAQSGKKVLLIDGDLRKPKIHRYMNIVNSSGLTDLLLDENDPKLIIKEREDIDNLWIATSGPIPPNPTEILLSDKMKDLLARLKQQYDLIIIDAPPAAQVTDATVLAGICDGVLMVLSAGETNIEMAKSAKKALNNVNARIIGAVLVKVDSKSFGGYYRYYSYDYK